MKRRMTKLFRGVFCMMIMLAIVIIPAQAALAATGDTVNLILSPATQTVNIGDTITVTVQAEAGTQTTDSVEAYINFDPQYLAVQSITAGTVLTLPVQNVYDNTAGTVDYSAGASPSVTGTFTVVTLSFTAKSVSNTTNTAVTFNTNGTRKTKVNLAGSSVTGALTGATYTINAPPDTTAPTVLSITPTNTATDVPINSTIAVTFSETMNHSTTEGAFSIDHSVTGTFGWNADSTTMTFTPSSNLANSIVYHVGITTAATDIAGNNLAVAFASTFTTLSSTLSPPVVASVAADPIGIGGATLNGNLTSLGTATSVNVSFEYGMTAAYGKTTPAQAKTAVGTFNAAITGLFPGMTWHYRAKADGGAQGIAYGADMTFTTISDATTPYGLAKFAFVSARDGNEEVYAVTPDDIYLARLTDNTFQEAWPRFLADFSKITFTSYRDGNAEVYVMNPDGTVQTRITNNTAFDGMSDFSWDASKIAFVSDRDSNYEIYVMNADGSNQTRLTNNLFSDIMPAFSPDGTKIAFVSNRDGNYEIYVMNSDGSNQTRLTNNAVTDNYPSWLNNGTKIAYSSLLSGNSEIYSMNANGTNPVNISNNAAADDQPTWCPTGGAIFFTSWRTDNIPQVYFMAPDGITQMRFTTDAQGNWSRANWTIPAGTFNITATVSGVGGIVTPTTQTVSSGTSATINITPDAGYHITGITDNAVSVAIANPYVIANVTGPHTVVVTFSNTYTITAAASIGGTISLGTATVSPGTSQTFTVDPGSSQTFTITPGTGNSIVSLIVDGSVKPVANSYTFTNVSTNHTISANFTAAEAPNIWWNSAWSRRIEITITEKSGVTLANYQVKIPVTYNANMKANFGDIRFVNSDNINEISYWMTNITAGGADFWVKVPSIPASGIVKIYMYYGNAAATTTSNIHNTFIWGDDFQDANWTNNNIRQVNYSNATQTIQNGILRHQGAAASEPITEIFEGGALKNFPDNYVAEVDINPGIKVGQAIVCPRYSTVASKYESVMNIFYNNAALNKVVNNIWSQIASVLVSGKTFNIGTWYPMTTIINNQGGSNHIQVIIDGNNYIDKTDPSLTNPGNPGLALITYDLNNSFDVSYDNFRVREYAATEPTPTLGQEQKQSPAVTTGVANNITSTGVTLNGNLNSKGTATTVTVSFEYGTTTGYGSTAVSVTPATVPGTFTANLNSLAPSTLYHFRAKVVGDGTSYGQDATFTTLATPSQPPGGGGGGGGGGGAAPPGDVPGFIYVKGLIGITGEYTQDITALSDDGRATLFIPEGTAGSTIYGFPLWEIYILKVTNPPLSPAGTNAVSLCYEFGPSGTYFNQPVTITITYDPNLLPEGADEDALYIAWCNEPTQEWIMLEGKVDTVYNTITITVNHFTKFSVFVPSEPANLMLGDFSVSPPDMNAGEAVTVNISVDNIGDLAGSYSVDLLINDIVTETQKVTVKGHSSLPVTFTYVPTEAGNYVVSIGRFSGSFTVNRLPLTTETVTNESIITTETPVTTTNQPESPDAQPTVVPVQPIEIANVPISPSTTAAPSTPMKTSSFNWLVIIIIAAVVVAIVTGGIIALRLLRRRD